MSYKLNHPSGKPVEKVRVETFSIGSCVCDEAGFNVLSFPNRPGTKFTDESEALAIVKEHNELRHMGY